MKPIKEERKMEKVTKISLQTVPNGYTLTVNGEGFMYFNEVDLLAGFLAHVGMRKPLPMEKSTILSGLFSALLGDEYAQTVTTLKCRAEQLESAYGEQMNALKASIKEYETTTKGVASIADDLKKLKEEVLAARAEHGKTLADVKAAQERLAELEKKSKKVEKTLDGSATLMDAMKETVEKLPAKEQPAKGTKKRGGRKKNDEAILKAIEEKAEESNEATLKEIEEKAKENPNVK